MNKEQVITLMRSSNSETEWNANCNKVKKACAGYPGYWYTTIILSGLFKQIASKWGGDMEIKIAPL